jgi:hypothetical protein
MGTWGTEIFDDDLAKDVEAAFATLLERELSLAAATKSLERKYAAQIRDQDDGPTFWLSLAALQQPLGVLPRVKAHALRVIESGEGLSRWKDSSKNRKARISVLEKLRKLLDAKPARLVASKKTKIVKTPEATVFELGTLLQYRFASKEEKLALLWVTQHFSDGGNYAIIDVLAWSGTRIPSAMLLQKLPVWTVRQGRRPFRLIMTGEGETYFPKARVQVLRIKRMPPPRGAFEPIGASLCSWAEIDKTLLSVEEASPFRKKNQ